MKCNNSTDARRDLSAAASGTAARDGGEEEEEMTIGPSYVSPRPTGF